MRVTHQYADIDFMTLSGNYKRCLSKKFRCSMSSFYDQWSNIVLVKLRSDKKNVLTFLKTHKVI